MQQTNSVSEMTMLQFYGWIFFGWLILAGWIAFRMWRTAVKNREIEAND